MNFTFLIIINIKLAIQDRVLASFSVSKLSLFCLLSSCVPSFAINAQPHGRKYTFAEMAPTFSLDNQVFKDFVFFAAILGGKCLLMSIFTAKNRILHKVFSYLLRQLNKINCDLQLKTTLVFPWAFLMNLLIPFLRLGLAYISKSTVIAPTALQLFYIFTFDCCTRNLNCLLFHL